MTLKNPLVDIALYFTASCQISRGLKEIVLHPHTARGRCFSLSVPTFTAAAAVEDIHFISSVLRVNQEKIKVNLMLLNINKYLKSP